MQNSFGISHMDKNPLTNNPVKGNSKSMIGERSMIKEPSVPSDPEDEEQSMDYSS